MRPALKLTVDTELGGPHNRATDHPYYSVYLSALIGVVTLLFGASGVFGQLQTSLNTIWGV